tara:strand:+ start:2887 stop:5589 length:2703 start_codon:yes stop_codon:yes gene_type:complete
MKKITLLLILLTGFAGFSQTVLEDFESTLPASALVEDLGTTVTVVPDPATSGTNGNVLKVVTSTGAGSQPYQNAQYIFQNQGIDMSTTEKTLTIDVYSDVATDVLAKLESGIGGASDSQVDTSTPHTGSGWETLSFNFSNGVAQNGSSNPANGVYGKLILFPLWGGDDFNAASETTTYYDNITGIAYTPPAQNITVSVDISETAGGVNIRVYNTAISDFDEFVTTQDPNDTNKFSYTFAEGVTSATYVWRLYPSDTPTDESLVSLVVGGAIENNLAATLGDNNGIDTDYFNYCSRTVTSLTGNYVAPTSYFNSFRQVGVEYTELVLTAPSGNDVVIDYSLNDFNENHGPGATDNGDGTYTAIVNPTSTFQYKWNNLTTSIQEDLSECEDGVGVANDGTFSNRTHAAGENKSDTFNVCPSNAQTITVSVDVSEFDGEPGVNIAVYNGTGFDEIPATVDATNPNKFSYTFADGVTTATYYWVTYTSPNGVGESLVSLVGGGAIENNLAATLGDNNGIASDYFSYCNRTVTSSTGVYVAPTFYHNSFRQVGVTYTKLVLTADAGDDIVIDYSFNNWDANHGPGAADNGDGTYTAIVNPTSAFEYKWNNLTTTTQEDLLACPNGNGINTDNANYANRVHVAGEDEADTFGVCPQDPAPTDAPTTPPTFDANNVISLYSDAYTAAATINNVGWDDSNFEEVSIAGNNVLKISGENFLGIDLSTYLDATNMTHLHMDYWIATDWEEGQVLNPKLSNHAAQGGETSAIDITNIIGSQAEVQNWQSKDFVLSGDRGSIKQFLVTEAGRTDLYYLDNVYLYVAGTAGLEDNNIIDVSVYPNPSNTNWNFRTGNTVITSVEVFNLLGKRVVLQNNNSTNVAISTQGLTSGIYIARITTEQGTKSVKLIKE